MSSERYDEGVREQKKAEPSNARKTPRTVDQLERREKTDRRRNSGERRSPPKYCRVSDCSEEERRNLRKGHRGSH